MSGDTPQDEAVSFKPILAGPALGARAPADSWSHVHSRASIKQGMSSACSA